jgi:hypothetical protein
MRYALAVIAVLLAGCSVNQHVVAERSPAHASVLGRGAVSAVTEFAKGGETARTAMGADARVATGPEVAGFGTLNPGTKIKGGNIVVKSDGGSWGGLFSEWDWDNWIKPQVDRAHILGMNTIRLIGDPSIIFMPAGANYPVITEEQYINRWRQLAEYTNSLGMKLYPAMCEKWAFWNGSAFDFADVDRMNAIKAVAKALAEYPNVIGFDVFQEGSGKDDGLTVKNVLDLYSSIRSVAPGIPLTTSNSSDGFGNPSDFWSDKQSIPYRVWTANGGSDFVDIHVYLENVNASDISHFLSLGKPLLIGEFGTPQSLTHAQQVSRIVSGENLHDWPGVLGSIVWGLADQGNTDDNEFGVWDNSGFSQDVSPLSTETGQRTSLTDLLRNFS